jgi:hypothetical protein
MPQSINTAAVESYIETLTEKLVFGHFNSSESITGPQIQELTELDQVNVFVLEQLFSKWKMEAENLRSPFFDFEHVDIKTALQEFQNSLSFHIMVDRTHFQPLLKDALNNTTDLILHPYKYITQNCLCLDEMIVDEHHIRNKTRYIKINKFLIEDALSQFNDKSTIPTEDFLKECSQIYLRRKEDFYKIEDFVKIFDYLIPEEHSQAFFLGEGTSLLNTEATPEQSIDDLMVPTDQIEPLEYGKIPPVEESLTAEEQIPINERFTSDQTSLADDLAENNSSSLKESIPFNDRYAFVNTLFEGDANEYNNALEQIEHLGSASEALTHLNSTFGEAFKWEEKQETVERLLSYLERRN